MTEHPDGQQAFQLHIHHTIAMGDEQLLPERREVVFPGVFVPASVSLAVILLNLTLLVLSWIVVFLRLCTRTFFSRMGRDDWFMVLTLVTQPIFVHNSISFKSRYSSAFLDQ